jgi:hypothetical protein
MARNGFKRLRYAAVSINLFGLILSFGTWTFEMWLRTHPLSHPYAVDFIRTIGVFCWVLGLLVFIALWIVEGFGVKW